MSSEVLGRSNALFELDVVTTEPSGRNRAETGLDLAAAFAVIALDVVGVVGRCAGGGAGMRLRTTGSGTELTTEVCTSH